MRQRAVMTLFLLVALLLSAGAAEAVQVFYYILYPPSGATWAPVRFDFFDSGQCNNSRTKSIALYGATLVWSNGAAGCVTETQP